MKIDIISKFIISLCFIFSFFGVDAQEQTKDTVKYKDRYGLRVGADIFTPIYGFFDEDRQGFELVGDFRLSKRFWIAGEFGYLDRLIREDFYSYSTSGGYIKVGADFNAYKNWIGMENMIVVGLRYGFSNYSQTLNEYTINSNPYLPLEIMTQSRDYDNLSAHWAEFILGLKVEVLHNIYLGAIFSGKRMISASKPDNFRNMFAPGFNRISVNDYGFGFSYTISYLIPFYKK